MTYREWLIAAITRLIQSESAKRDAEILLGFVTQKSRTFIMAFDETPLNSDELQRLDTLLCRRSNGEPIAYLVGQREFWSLPLHVSPATLIPRPDTECLVEAVLSRFTDNIKTILDLGTGSGAIALALASEQPHCKVIGVDRRADAVALAHHNARVLAISNVDFKVSHWFSALVAQRFDLIVSNPPYIDASDPHLTQGDVRFEPTSALIAANQGLADIEIIIQQSGRHLSPKGLLAIEHGWKQAKAVRQLFTQNHFQTITTVRDYGGQERITLGYYSP